MKPVLVLSLLLAVSVSPIIGAPADEANSKPELLSRTGGGKTWSDLPELQKAAESGNHDAEAALGEMLVMGDQVTKDVPKGVALLEKAAKANQATAAFRLGKMYDDGDGVAPDPSKAVAYYMQAAKAGVSAAQYNLGVLYLSAREGIKRDYKEGLAWLIVATKHGASGDGEAKVRERLKKTRREAIIAQSEQRAAEIEKELAATSGSNAQNASESAPTSRK
ncbi:MAG TPA: tetratricopeptide repeat protein [Opitutaceae bacterium]|nr:tetratricopeptide repeat protein [Opitutaceae bacterium]